MIAAAFLLMPLVNAARGRAWPLWLTLPGVAAAAALDGLEPLTIGAFVLAFYLWQLGPWGHWIGLGRFDPVRPRDQVERIIELAAAGSPHVALFMRHFFWIAPVLWIIAAATHNGFMGALALPFALVAVGSYELGWRLVPNPKPEPDLPGLDFRLLPRRPIVIGEWGVGLAWASLMALASL
jgi:hypothetical protein